MKLLPTLILGATFVASAHASDTVDTHEWTLIPNSDAKAVYTTQVDEPALVLSCSDQGKVSAVIGIEGNLMENLQEKRSNSVFLRATLTVGDQEPVTDRWRFYTKTKFATPTDGKLKRRLYNAAITGSEVTLDLGRRGTFSFTPPEMNEDFLAFANGCAAQ